MGTNRRSTFNCGRGTLAEPGVFGVRRPILLLPAGITDRLTPPQLKAIVAHEQCHVRRRDNLATAIHMGVEALFWFHPLVWWLGARLMEERERACDEEVLLMGSEPRVYAEGILKICELYLESPLPCVSGVTGANLRTRIEGIMTNRTAVGLTPARKALLVFAGISALAAPVIVGVINAPFARAQSSASATQAPRNGTPTFDAASVKPTTLPAGGMFMGNKVAVRKADGSGFSVVANTGGPGTGDPGRIHYPFIALKDLLDQAFDSFLEIQGPSWMDNDLIQVDATIPPGTTREGFQEMLRNLIVDRFQLRYHVETKGETTGYTLMLAKNGPEMKESPAVSSAAPGSAPEGSSGKRQIGPDGFPIVVNAHPGQSGDAIQSIPGNRHKVVAWQLTMGEFARDLAHVYKIRVVDATGLKAKYDFTMFFGGGPNDTNPSIAQPPAGAAAASASDSQDFPDFFEALQWQLGLRMEVRKMPAQVMVIDHVEKTPTGN